MSGYERKNTTANSITITKRKRNSISEQSENVYEKSNRKESITLKPHRSFTPGFSQRDCKPVRHSKSSLRRRRRTKEKISSSVEREWVFSANNFENLAGLCALQSHWIMHLYAFISFTKYHIPYFEHIFILCVWKTWYLLFNSSDKLVLVSYNLLGVDNASNHMDLYYNVPRKHLEWSRRKHLICKEISRYNASILCLQASSRGLPRSTLFKFHCILMSKFIAGGWPLWWFRCSS
jgi:hypothetical protein